VTPWEACGNRLLVIVEPADDDRLRGAAEIARHCFAGGERIADGVAWFAPRDGFHRTVFFNPDGSFEQLCGNSLLVAAAKLGVTSPEAVHPLDYPPVAVHSVADRVEASARVPLARVVRERSAAGPVFDTGSPHLVISHENVSTVDFPAFARPLVEAHDVNVTLYALCDGVATVRTFERGVNAETLACGTGALAVALASGRAVEVRYPGGTYAAHAERAGEHVRWKLSTSVEHVRVSVKR
jgi:diaminopimelate epimerase